MGQIFRQEVGLGEKDVKPLDRQKLDVVNKTLRPPALRAWRGLFTPEFGT